jgi:hypothetical protein
VRAISSRLKSALAVTSEVCGIPWTKEACAIVEAKLGRLPEAQVLGALDRCQNEVKGRLSLADIIERLDDGRPAAEEAWATVESAGDEARTVITTDEALMAFGEVRGLAKTDQIAARMAFKDAYKRIVTESRAQGFSPKWTASLGHDKEQRVTALQLAVDKGRLSADDAKAYGILEEPKGEPLKLLPGKVSNRNDLAVANFSTLLQVLAGELSEDEASKQIVERYGDKA